MLFEIRTEFCKHHPPINLSAFSSDTSSELNILRHNGDSLGVDGAQVGVLEQTDQIGLARLLQSSDRRRLESQVGLEILRDLAHQSLKRQFSDQELSALLVATDLAQSYCARAISVRLFDSASRGR